MSSCTFQYPADGFPLACLSVYPTFSCNDNIGIHELPVKSYGIKNSVCTFGQPCVEEACEGAPEASCRPGSGHVRQISPDSFPYQIA